MDTATSQHGYSIVMPDQPANPWLRLAHCWDPPPVLCPGHGLVRTLMDFEFFLVVRGASWLWLAEQQAHVPLPTGSLALIPPGLCHAYGETRCTHLAVHADLHAAPEVGVPANMRLAGRLVESGPRGSNLLITLRWGRDLITYPLVQPVDLARWQLLFAPLIAAYGGGTHRHRMTQVTTMGILAQAFSDAWRARSPADPVARVLADVAAEQPARRHSSGELARRAGLGETAFRAAVLRLTGRAPQAHLEHVRLQRAAHLLRSTSLPVQAVALAVGYDDPFHFSRVFKNSLGLSPHNWRERR